MKKIFSIILVTMAMLFCVSNTVSAQTYYYKTKQFAIKYKGTNGWGEWSDWEASDMKMKIDMDDDLIVIYSKATQIYRVLEDMGSYTDESGGKQQKFWVIDQDDDYGYVRLRIEKNGNSQIYVDFNDVMWVYNVVRVQ